MKFRLADIAYLFALSAVCFGVFGAWGVIFAAGLAYYWKFSARRPPTFRDALVVVLFVMMVPFALAMLSPVHSTRLSKRNTDCRGHLRGLALALTLEAEANCLPQAIVRDSAGKPFRSWRVSLFPRVELKSLHESYDVDESWDSSGNQDAFAHSLNLFVCANDPPVSHDDLHTNYFAVVGDQTAWPESRGRRLEELTDGLDQTILILEAHHLNALVSQPRDLTFDDALRLLTSQPKDDDNFHVEYASPRYFYRDPPIPPPGVHAAFADGTVRFLPVPLPEEMARAMLTANAGDEVDWDEFERLTAPQLDYAKIYATIAFAVVALWPARRLFRARPVLAPGSLNRGEG